MDTELMVRHRRTRERHESICIRAFPKENLILTHYMLSTWWLHLLNGLGQYVIFPGSISHILMMTNNVIALGYTYVKCRLNNPPNIFCQIALISRIIVWIPSRLSQTPVL